MLPHEVSRIVAKQEEKSEKAPKLKIAFREGERVKINEGTFENFEGEVDSIDETNGRVTVMINIFGRSTPVELEYWQIESTEPALAASGNPTNVMAKQLVGEVKFQVPGGQATPAPPVGTSLGRYGINLGQFVQQFNERTKDAGGMPIPVVVKVYNDRSFEFVTKSPPAAALLKQAAGIAKGSGVPNKEKVGKVTMAQIDEICKTKMADLNARDLEHARQLVEGTARSMGIEVIEGLGIRDVR